MIRFKQAFTSLRECFAHFVPLFTTPRHDKEADFCQQSQQSIDPTRLSIASRSTARAITGSPSSPILNARRRITPVSLVTTRNVPATVTVERHAAHVGKFSHGSGLIVYVNGALMSAANVALRVNIAALELVRRLPLDELGAVGACLAAAFIQEGRQVDVSWTEVDSETEQEWREAERNWMSFPGGPYEADEYSDNSLLQQSLRWFEEKEGMRLARQGAARSAEWAAFLGRRLHLGSEEPSSLRSDTDGSSISLFYEEYWARSVTTAEESDTSPKQVKSFSTPSSRIEVDKDVEMTAIEVREILRARCPPKTPSNSASDRAIQPTDIMRPSDVGEIFPEPSDKQPVRGLWSPGEDDGPIMSSEAFGALPNWSDSGDESDWSSSTGSDLEQDEVAEFGEVVSGRIW